LACKYVGERDAPCFFGGLLLEHEHYKPGRSTTRSKRCCYDPKLASFETYIIKEKGFFLRKFDLVENEDH